MKKAAAGFVALCCVLLAYPSFASSLIRVSELQSPVWVQQVGNKSSLKRDDNVDFGSRLSTGESGRIELELWSNITVQIYGGSEVGLLAEQGAGEDSSDPQPRIVLHRGRICLNFAPRAGLATRVALNVSNTIVTAENHHGFICVSRQADFSSVRLREGSVRVMHTSDPDLIILSKAGTEIRVSDDGSYELQVPAADDPPTPENDAPFIDQDKLVSESSVDSEQETELVVESKTATSGITSPVQPVTTTGYIYTVYLFSTRSEEVAEQVNRKFQDAGHDSRIIVNAENSAARYRIAVSGFETLESAREFASSVTGTLGISGTWIGKDRPDG